MIIYKDILGKLKEAGYSTYRLRKDKILGDSTVAKLKNNGNISLEIVDKLCELLDCKIEDIIEYRKE